MEGVNVEAFLDGEWESLSKLFSCEDSAVELHFNGANLLLNDCEFDPSFLASGLDHHHHPAAGFDLASFHCVSQESSNSSTDHYPPNVLLHHQYLLNDATLESINFPAMDDDLMEEVLQLKAQILSNVDQRDDDHHPFKETPHDCAVQSQPSSKKRPRVSRVDAQTNKKNIVQSRKKKKACNDNEEGINGHISSTCNSEEDDSESKGTVSTGKAKPSKGPATDPQSLYARKRRERINERLRILQNLVPNGTKVDISTMLEEAVHYVKFLQLQIRLLSSDDLWMYAPIAYNGMDIGVYQKIVPNL